MNKRQKENQQKNLEASEKVHRIQDLRQHLYDIGILEDEVFYNPKDNEYFREPDIVTFDVAESMCEMTPQYQDKFIRNEIFDNEIRKIAEDIGIVKPYESKD